MEEYLYDRDPPFQELSTPQVQEDDFHSTIDSILEEVRDEGSFDLMHLIHNKSSYSDGRWSDSTQDQSLIPFYNSFAEYPELNHEAASSVQPKLSKADESLASRKSTALSCAWPDCKVSTKRQSDLTRHVNTVHFPAHIFQCKVIGCNKHFYRKDKLQDHERHHSKILKGISKTTNQSGNDALALRNDESGSSSLGCLREILKPNGIQDFDLDSQRSTPATEDSGGPSEDLSRTSEGLSRENSISTKSTSSFRTISSRNLSDLHSASQAREINLPRRSFACPFRKHNRREYDIHKHKSCAMSGWATVHRMKEHLYRRHMAPIQCTRCWAIFTDNKGLYRHFSATQRCELQLGSPAEGIAPEIEKQLKAKRRIYIDRSEEDKWKDIYSLLFPHEQIPSPYFDPIEDFAPTENVVSRDASCSELNKLKNTNPPDLEDFAIYVRKKLPGLVESQLKAAFDREEEPTLDGPQRSKLVSIFTECHDLMVQKYRERLNCSGGVPSPSPVDDAGSACTSSRVDLGSQDTDMDS